jgi:hypothetical protein
VKTYGRFIRTIKRFENDDFDLGAKIARQLEKQKDKQDYLSLMIDFTSFVARNCTNNRLKTITKNESTLTKTRFAKKVTLKKVTIVKKKLVSNEFVKLTLIKSRKAMASKSSIKNLANTRSSMLVSEASQVCILSTLLLLIFIANLILFRTINLITIVRFIRSLKRLSMFCYVKSN